MTLIEDRLKVIHLGALNESLGLRTLRPTTAWKGHQAVRRPLRIEWRFRGEVIVPIVVCSHVAYGQIPDALEGVEVVERMRLTDRFEK